MLFPCGLYSQHAGDIDSTFGKNGFAFLRFPDNKYVKTYYDIAVEADDGIVISGGISLISSRETYAFLAKYSPNGVLDPNFADNGFLDITKDVPQKFYGQYAATSVKLVDGKIIVLVLRKSISVGNDFVLLRYTSTGNLDKTFGNEGVIISDVDGAFINKFFVQADGKIVVPGSYKVERYNTDGTLDLSYGVNGIIDTKSLLGVDYYLTRGASMDSEGRLVLTGNAQEVRSAHRHVLTRYNQNGQLDISFGSGGVAVSGGKNQSPIPQSIYVDTDNKIFTTGIVYDDKTRRFLALSKYHEDGSFDDSFGHNGTVKIRENDGYFFGGSIQITVQDDGKILMLDGNISLNGRTTFLLRRFNADGKIDSTFGTNGIVVYLNRLMANAYSVALQSTGKILLCGNYGTNFSYRAEGAFLLRVFSEDASFDSATEKNEVITKRNNTIFLYPNPALDLINITGLDRTETTYYFISDNKGELVMKGILGKSPISSIGISRLKTGIYYLHLKNSRELTRLTFIKR